MTAFESLKFIIPEFVLTCLMVMLIIISLWEKCKSSRLILTMVSVSGLLISLACIFFFNQQPNLIFQNMLSHDPFSDFFRIIIIISGVVTILSIYPSKEIQNDIFSEFCIILISLVLGLCFFVSSVNFLMLYLSLEFVSITSYVLTGFKKNDTRASEASLKYVIYGGVVSGIMLFGISYFYGLFGTFDIYLIKQGLISVFSETSNKDLIVTSIPALKLTVIAASLFSFAGIGYKIAVVPFHMWCPDVYEGAPTCFTAFLSVAPKLAGIAVLIRFIFTGFVLDYEVVSKIPWPEIFVLLSIITMFVGNLSALAQKNIKRLLAYSGIAHCGYLLMGVAAISQDGIFATNFYSLIYLFMNLGAFIIVIAIRETTGKETLDSYAGLGATSPFMAATFSIFLLSLAGVPPFAGFIAKFYLFAAIINKGTSLYYVLAFAGILNSVIALYYYAFIVRIMYFRTPENPKLLPSHVKTLFYYKIIAFILLVPVIVMGIYWQPAARKVGQSVYFASHVYSKNVSKFTTAGSH